jgi:hypothetical protein
MNRVPIGRAQPDILSGNLTRERLPALFVGLRVSKILFSKFRKEENWEYADEQQINTANTETHPYFMRCTLQ